MKLQFSIMLLLISAMCIGQQVEYSNLKSNNLDRVRAIVQDQRVQGYYSMFKLDKELYELRVFDLNLKETHSVKLNRDKGEMLVQAAFNGSHFCFHFWNMKSKDQEFVILDITGKKTGAIKIPSDDDITIGTPMIYGSQSEGSLAGIEGVGFVFSQIQKINKLGMKSHLVAFDSKGKNLWKSNDLSKEKAYETGAIIMANAKVIVSMYSTRSSMMSVADATSGYSIYDSATGQELGHINEVEGDKARVILGAKYENESSNILLYGEIFGTTKGKFLDPKAKKGLFFARFSEEGLIISETINSWDGDLKSAIPDDPDSKKDDNFGVAIMEVVNLSNGAFYAIGEQYNKVVSGLGVASKILNGHDSNTSAFQINSYNMVVFKFDKDFNLENIELVKKDKSPIYLPAGYGNLSEDKLAYVLKSIGSFDYVTTTLNADGSSFNSLYLNYDKSGKGAGSNHYECGNIGLDRSNTIAVDRVKIDKKTDFFRVYPAKPGYLCIFEYDKRENQGVLRLEKLDL